MNDYYDQYVWSTGDADAQGARQFIWLVARHIVGEELVIYPLMEKYLGNPGKMLADEGHAVHQKVKKLLHNIESHKPGSPEHVAILKSVMEYLRSHNDDEVQRDLPLLTKTMGEAASVKAASSFKRTEKFAPSRTHPGALSKPPFETAAGLLEAPIDWLKNLFAKFPKDSELFYLQSKNALIDAIADDNQEIYSYYDQYTKSTQAGDVDAQESWARQLIWDVARHIVGVEFVVHPLLGKHLHVPGEKLAHDGHVVHQKIRELLYDIESHKPDLPEHVAILTSVMEHLRPHNDNEVKRDLPLLIKAIRKEDSVEAAASFERTKKFAPTRADPDVHNKLPFETSAALMEAPIDQLKDIFANFL